MASVSLCMIVRNEEAVLERCLDSVRHLVDEILIADTGSEDLTRSVAEKYTSHIWDFPWRDDFSAARNFIFSKARTEYCMWLDADDLLPESSAGPFARLKDTLDPAVDIAVFPYHTAFDPAGRPVCSCQRERLIRSCGRFRFQGRVHEAIPLSGNVIFRDIPVEHRKNSPGDPERNLRIYRKMLAEGEPFTPRDLYYYGRELLDHGDYEESRKIFLAFLESPDGWAPDRMDAARQLAVCCRRLGDDRAELDALLGALTAGVPSGELCCDLGRYFMERGYYEQAAYWFRQALQADRKSASGAFIQEECYGFYPAASLCVCHDRLGDRAKAILYNELAGAYQPESPYYLQNKAYLESPAQEIRRDDPKP